MHTLVCTHQCRCAMHMIVPCLPRTDFVCEILLLTIATALANVSDQSLEPLPIQEIKQLERGTTRMLITDLPLPHG